MFIYNCNENGNICMTVYSLGPEILYSFYMSLYIFHKIV